MGFIVRTENVGSSRLADGQLTELQQVEHQLHQHAVSMLGYRNSKDTGSDFVCRLYKGCLNIFTWLESYCGIL